jgi:hypothetical protein
MTKYRNNLSAQAAPPTTERSTTDAGRVRPHSTLAARYCALPAIRVRSSQPAPQGVDQEFNAYTLAMPSPEGTHPLSFWEVSLDLMYFFFCETTDSFYIGCKTFIPDYLCNRSRLPPHSGVCCPVRACLFFKQ